jgi:hypothetical protein
MSRAIVEALEASFASTAKLVAKLAEICPDSLWQEKAGLWPIWQHVTHCGSAISFFTPGDPVALPKEISPDVANLKVVGEGLVEKQVVLGYFNANKALAEAFMAGLADSDLTKNNAKVKPFGLEWTIAQTLVLFSSHINYHLGHADAVLRANGLEGAF